MREVLGPPLRAAAFGALIIGLIVLILNPPSLAGVDDLVVILVGALAIVLATAWLTVAMIGEEAPEPEFQRLVPPREARGSLRPLSQPPNGVLHSVPVA